MIADVRVSAGFIESCSRWVDTWGVPLRQLEVEAGEALKTLGGWKKILDYFDEIGLDRDGCVLAVGGGSVGDAAGFAAAVWLRGVPWVGVPTTLLGMVDAFVGGKTGLNHLGVKNVLGTFHMASRVQIDLNALVGLPEAELRSGWGEVVKTAIVEDPGLFEAMESGSVEIGAAPSLGVIERCLRAKAAIVTEDYRDTGRRMLLNLGHTLGHALEAWGGADGIRHGEAVAVGIVFAARIAQDLGLCAPGLADRLAAVLSSGGLPVAWDAGCSEQLLSLMARDKKNRGLRFRMALPVDVGTVEIHRVPIERLVDRLHRGAEL